MDEPPGVPRPRQAATIRLLVYMAILVLVAETIGGVTIPLGAVSVTMLPLLWALLMGAGWGLADTRLPRGVALPIALQVQAAQLLQPALLLFTVKLALMVGVSLPSVWQSGWALVFQEFGHFFGTMAFGLPLALLLGIKREAIGATFSIGREPSLAIIAERFGMNSPEGRGVLAEYLSGTVFGALFIAILVGVVSGLHLFEPRALAMAAGVGSGSMMAAAVGAIAAKQPTEVAEEVAALAAASNLITTTIGTYFTLFLSLPFTIWAYSVLEPVLGRTARRAAPPAGQEADLSGGQTGSAAYTASVLAIAACWIATGLAALFGNWLHHGGSLDGHALIAVALIIGITGAATILHRVARRKLPAVLWCSMLGMLATYPAFPWSGFVTKATGHLNFLALTTPMLAFAGLSVAKDVPAFRRLGWRIVVVSLAANGGTFLGAALIAQYLLRHAS